jgi:hypothetical protein
MGMIECMRRFGPFATVIAPPKGAPAAAAQPANLVSAPRAARRAKG